MLTKGTCLDDNNDGGRVGLIDREQRCMTIEMKLKRGKSKRKYDKSWRF